MAYGNMAFVKVHFGICVCLIYSLPLPYYDDVQCTLYIICTFYTVRCIVYIVYCTMYTASIEIV